LAFRRSGGLSLIAVPNRIDGAVIREFLNSPNEYGQPKLTGAMGGKLTDLLRAMSASVASPSDVIYPDFPKRGAFVPRNRSANQNAPIATNARRKIPPHDRKVSVKFVSMTFSQER
jgi:hypothetical protein